MADNLNMLKFVFQLHIVKKLTVNLMTHKIANIINHLHKNENK